MENEVVDSLRKLKARRSAAEVARCLAAITADAKAEKNVMPALIDGAKAYCTVGEMMGALEQALGRFDTGQIF